MVCPVWLEKAMAPHSSTLAWKILWMEEPGRLQFTGSQRVWHDRVTSLSLSNYGGGNEDNGEKHCNVCHWNNSCNHYIELRHPSEKIFIHELSSFRSAFSKRTNYVWVLSCVHLCDPTEKPIRLFCPWDYPSKNTQVGCHFLLQGSSWPPGGGNSNLLHTRYFYKLLPCKWASRN